ncbi:MAG: hypothetical protein P8X86_20735, partial [Desulfofustis sp.]
PVELLKSIMKIGSDEYFHGKMEIDLPDHRRRLVGYFFPHGSQRSDRGLEEILAEDRRDNPVAGVLGQS